MLSQERAGIVLEKGLSFECMYLYRKIDSLTAKGVSVVDWLFPFGASWERLLFAWTSFCDPLPVPAPAQGWFCLKLWKIFEDLMLQLHEENTLGEHLGMERESLSLRGFDRGWELCLSTFGLLLDHFLLTEVIRSCHTHMAVPTRT